MYIMYIIIHIEIIKKELFENLFIHIAQYNKHELNYRQITYIITTKECICPDKNII